MQPCGPIDLSRFLFIMWLPACTSMAGWAGNHMRFFSAAFLVSLLVAGLPVFPARGEDLSLTLGIRMNCPYGLAG